MISRTNCMRISSNGHAVARSALARPAAARVPAQRISLRPLRSTNSWEPTTELIAKADQAKVEELQRRFREADKDGSGFIDRAELRELLNSTDGGKEALNTALWLSDADLDAVMAKYDTDGNGTISFDEFGSLVYDGILLDGKLAEYEAAFRAADSTGNGSIGATEVARLFEGLGQPLSFGELTDIFKKYDKDSSGQIELNEFLQMFRDKLVDLEAVRRYVTQAAASAPADASASGRLVDLLSGDVTVILSDRELDEALALAARDGKRALLFCSLSWCRPCMAMQRTFQKLAAHYPGVAFLKLMGDANGSTKELFKDRLKVRSTPSFFLFDDGTVSASMTGAKRDKLEALLRSNIPQAQLPAEFLYPETEAVLHYAAANAQ